jgi:hypothetical protein
MALYDVLFEFADAQAIYTGTGDKAATNCIDMQASDLEMGAGTPIWLNIRVSTAFAGAGTATFKLVNDTNATIDGSSKIILATRAFAITEIDAAGDWVIRAPLPTDFDFEQYIGVLCTCSGAMTAGSVDAWLDHGPQSSYDTQVTTSNI